MENSSDEPAQTTAEYRRAAGSSIRVTRFAAAIVVTYFAINAGLFAFLGIRAGADTPRYEGRSASSVPGDAVVSKGRSYLGYIAIVHAIESHGLGRGGVIALQLLAGVAALAAVFVTARAIGGPTAGLIGAGLLAFNLDLWRFNFYVLTDSLYAVALVTVAALTARFLRTHQRIDLALAGAAVIATTSLRPNGWVVQVFLVVFALARSGRRAVRAMIPLFLAGLVAAAVLVPPLRMAIEAERPLGHLLDGTVVWGGARHPMPAAASAAREWTAGGAYLLRHPMACATLAGARVGAELLHVRAAYSPRHNAAILLFYLPMYGLAAIGFARHRHDPTAQLTLGLIASQLLVVALLFADWDGRFLLHVVPLVSVLAGLGAALIVGPLAPGDESAPREEEPIRHP